MLLASLAVILVKTRFPENIGMAARACANMGCPQIRLVQPERWDPLKAAPVATAQGMQIINAIQIFQDLPSALDQFSVAYATTARLGGWRKGIKTPAVAAEQIVKRANEGEKIALVFGPEDRGLENSELAYFQDIVSIPVEKDAKSLNLAQAVLISLYECRKAFMGKAKISGISGSYITCGERNMLEQSLKKAFVELHCLPERNQDYFFQQWRDLLNRASLRRHDYDALMGLARQILNRLEK